MNPRGRVTDRAVTCLAVHHVPCPFVVSVAAWSGGLLHHRRPVRSRVPAFATPALVPSRRRATLTEDEKFPSHSGSWFDLEALLHAWIRCVRAVASAQAPVLPWAWMITPPLSPAVPFLRRFVAGSW